MPKFSEGEERTVSEMDRRFLSCLEFVDNMVRDEEPEPPRFIKVFTQTSVCPVNCLDADGEPYSGNILSKGLALLGCREEIEAFFVCTPAMGVNKDMIELFDEDIQEKLKECECPKEAANIIKDAMEKIDPSQIDVKPSIMANWYTRDTTYLCAKMCDQASGLWDQAWEVMTLADAKKFENDLTVKNPFTLSNELLNSRQRQEE